MNGQFPKVKIQMVITYIKAVLEENEAEQQ